jgi:MerR family copper efflux transcriptional regulator
VTGWLWRYEGLDPAREALRETLCALGFRLYSEDAVARLEVIKRMKPLGFTVDEMRELLALLSALDAGGGDGAQLLDRLQMFHEAATARVTALQEQLTVAKDFANTLAGHLDARR